MDVPTPQTPANSLTVAPPTVRTAAAPQNEAPKIKWSCSNCNLRKQCVPLGLSKDQLDRIDSLVAHRRKVKKGEQLFHHAEKFTHLFVIHTGFFKSYLTLADGYEQVTGFQMAGEVLGLDGIADDRHTCNAVALEDSQVCLIPFHCMQDLSRDIPSLQGHIQKLLSRKLVSEVASALLGSMGSEKRLATFLLNLADRLHSMGFSQSELVLRMTREDIGSYLGLKKETVSRTLAKLSEDGLVEVHHRNIRFVRIDLLRDFVGRPIDFSATWTP